MTLSCRHCRHRVGRAVTFPLPRRPSGIGRPNPQSLHSVGTFRGRNTPRHTSARGVSERPGQCDVDCSTPGRLAFGVAHQSSPDRHKVGRGGNGLLTDDIFNHGRLCVRGTAGGQYRDVGKPRSPASTRTTSLALASARGDHEGRRGHPPP
jgi:hypothetical protein